MRRFTSTDHTFRLLRKIAASSWGSVFAATKSHLGIFLIFCLCLVITTFNFVEASPENRADYQEYLDMPLEYGEVIYRINAQSPKQLYIIGISHRDPDSGANSGTTVQTQMEIFRIGEWLKKNQQLNLLLPEGYFKGNKTSPSDLQAALQAINPFHPGKLENSFLQEKLAADKPFINAEMLLMEHHSIRACQVEDRKTYDAVRTSLGKLRTAKAQPSESADNIAELRYLQEVRTAQLLQNIPAVIEDEFHNGSIGNRTALFTIGLNHIKDIFRYIENDGISIVPPSALNIQPDILKTKLNLLKTGYGVTIIIPRTLANDRNLLKMTDIDQILLADGKYPRQAQALRD
jgi:hypothetical protein